MPFSDPQIGRVSTVSQPIEPDYNYEPLFFDEVVPAAFRLENSIGSATAEGTFDVTESAAYDPDFDPVSLVPEQHKMSARAYVFANNQAEIDQVTQRLDRENADRETVAAAGGLGILALISAGLFDPINLIPVGGEAWRTYRGGGSILRGALATGTAAMAGATASEAALQATQLSRTWGESALNVGAGTLLGGMLGSAAGVLASRHSGTFDDIANQFMADMERDPLSSTAPASVGAAAANAVPAGGNAIATPNLATKLAVKAFDFQDPLIRMTSPDASPVANELAAKLAETPLSLGKNYADMATPPSVERLAKNWQAPLYRSIINLDEQYSQYVFGRSKRIGDKLKAAAGRLTADESDRKLSFTQFRQEVGKAMRVGDQHAIPEVAEAAKHFRKEVFEPLKDEAIKLKLLPEDVTTETAVSYLNRVYDLEKLAQPNYRAKAVTVISDWLEERRMEADTRVGSFGKDVETLDAGISSARSKIDELNTKLAKVEGDVKAKIESEISVLQKSIQGLTRQMSERQDLHFRDTKEAKLERLDLQDIAERIIQRIEGTPGGRLPYDIDIDDLSPGGQGGNRTGMARALKSRVFNIPDSRIEFILEDDIEVLSRLYSKTMAADVEMVRAFGNIDLEKERVAITEHWEGVARKLGITDPEGANNKAARDWRNKRDAEIRDLMAMKERILGTYAMPKDPKGWLPRAGRAVRGFNLLTDLGGAAVSSTVDTFHVAMVHGFGRLFGDALAPMIRGAKQIKLAKADVKDMGAAVEMVLHSRQHEMSQLEDSFSRYTKLEKALGRAQDAYGTVSLLAPLTDWQKTVAGVVSQSRILRAVKAEALGKLSKKESVYLRQAGIGPEQSKLILAEFEKYGGEEAGNLSSGWNQWTNKEARIALQSAIGRDVDRIITTPGQDKTLISSGGEGWGELGKMMFQFKSFAVAAIQRILISGLQQGDMAALSGMASMLTMGMMVYAFKTLEKGEELPDDPATWLLEGVDRSGLTGWFMDANNMTERLTRGQIGLHRFAGGRPLSRYASKNVVGSLLGPTAGTLTDAATATGSLAASTLGEDDWTESDTRAVRRIIPFQNLLGFRHIIDQAEQGINSTLGVKQSRSN